MSMREVLIKKHIEDRISVPALAKIFGYHENSLYLWKARYLKSGIEGLKDSSRAPLTHRNEYLSGIKEAIRDIRTKALRQEKRYLGPKVIAVRLKKQYGHTVSPSGIGKFLNREGLIPLENKKRRPKKERIKKCRIHNPGELLQLDVKYGVKSYAGHWLYEYDCIDYMTGIVYGEIYELQSNFESILFLTSLQRKIPFHIKGIQTDNGSVFTNYYTGYKKSVDPSHPRIHCFDLLCSQLGITHYLIDPGKPAQNGKIERFHGTVERDFYQKESFKDLNSLRRKFRDFLYYYNNEREHSANNYLTPLEKLRTFPRYANIKEIAN